MSDQPFPAPILVVEDEGDLRALIGYNLSRSGYAVELTADLGSARHVLECATPSLVILDLMLPDGSGLDLARQIRQSPLSEASRFCLSPHAQKRPTGGLTVSRPRTTIFRSRSAFVNCCDASRIK
jgi:CheY-like chemotaxis protein